MKRKPKPKYPHLPEPQGLPPGKEDAPDPVKPNPVDRLEDEEAEADEDDRDGLGVRPGG